MLRMSAESSTDGQSRAVGNRQRSRRITGLVRPLSGPIAKQDDSRSYAREAVRLASNASSTAKKSLLLALRTEGSTLQTPRIRGFRVIEADGLRRVSDERQNGE